MRFEGVCEVRGLYIIVTDDAGLLGCDAQSLCNWFIAFPTYVSPSSSRVQGP